MKPHRPAWPQPPIVFPGDEPFWEAARGGRLLAKHCSGCGKLHYYSRAHCPFCGSLSTQWQALSGHGRIYSYTLVARAARPMAPAIVETDEGLRIPTVVVDADVHALRIGDAVRVRFVPSAEGPPVPAFTTPAAEAARAYSRAALAAVQESTDASDAAGLARAAVVGAGHMGVGITLALLAGGLRVHLIDSSSQALSGALSRIAQTVAQDVGRGRLSPAEADDRLRRLSTGEGIAAVAESDVVVEAVWEDMALKRQVFAQIDAHAREGALLATNTSTLDVGEIAAATRRPGDVLGLHFFNPAQVMKLVEVVRAGTTDPRTLALGCALARRIGKVPVVVGVCDGFVGNRLMITRERQAARLLLEGALPEQVDRVLREFGLPMGTFELQDMAGGIALMHRARQRAGQRDWLIEQLFERGRTGLQAGRGFYRYEPGKRRPIPDPEVAALIAEASRQAGIERRALCDAEIRDRLILPMVNEGAKLLAERVVARASDVDLVWQFGYGWPDWKGGPMYYADTVGLPALVDKLATLHAQHGEVYRPAELLVHLARTGARLSEQIS